MAIICGHGFGVGVCMVGVEAFVAAEPLGTSKTSVFLRIAMNLIDVYFVAQLKSDALYKF